MCQEFNRGSTSDLGGDGSAFLLFRSADGGASWSFPGSIVTQSDGTGADGIGLLDKEYMTIDTGAQSPFRDRIYVTWTQYSPDFSSAPILLAYSDDHGVTWTNVGAISGRPPTFAPSTSAARPRDMRQRPVLGPVRRTRWRRVRCVRELQQLRWSVRAHRALADPNDNHNQILMVKSTDGGTTFGAPVKVADFYDLPDCATYTGFDFGRSLRSDAAAVGTSIFRAANYPSGVALPDQTRSRSTSGATSTRFQPQARQLLARRCLVRTFLNLYTASGRPEGCNNDIVRSVSTNGGASFSGTSTPRMVAPVGIGAESLDRPMVPVDGEDGFGPPMVSFYDRSYGDAESTGFMDFTLTGRGDHRSG